jgi:hypothetical protein
MKSLWRSLSRSPRVLPIVAALVVTGLVGTATAQTDDPDSETRLRREREGPAAGSSDQEGGRGRAGGNRAADGARVGEAAA